jgi:hypothetical protein
MGRGTRIRVLETTCARPAKTWRVRCLSVSGPTPRPFPPPPWSVDDPDALLQYRVTSPRHQRVGARLRLFRGGAGSPRGGAICLPWDEARRIAANIAKLRGLWRRGVRLDALQPRITHCMAGLEPVIHATAHDILDQGEGPRANRLVVEADVQVFGLHRPIR